MSSFAEAWAETVIHIIENKDKLEKGEALQFRYKWKAPKAVLSWFLKTIQIVANIHTGKEIAVFWELDSQKGELTVLLVRRDIAEKIRGEEQ